MPRKGHEVRDKRKGKHKDKEYAEDGMNSEKHKGKHKDKEFRRQGQDHRYRLDDRQQRPTCDR